MTSINIKVNIDNDAFCDRLTEELAGVLNTSDIVNRVSEAGLDARIKLLDSNGNTCGEAWVSDAPEVQP